MQKGYVKKARLAEVCGNQLKTKRLMCVLGQGSVSLGSMLAMGVESFLW